MVNLALDFCRNTGVKGDYFEFGVYRGTTFSYVFHASRLRKMENLHLYALDSFEGFSAPQGKDDIGVLQKGGRSCSESEFRANLERAGVDTQAVTVIPGFFDTTLTGSGKADTEKKIGDTKAAIIYVDCDLYEPARDTLAFMTSRITDGTVLIFDNWFLFRGSPYRGERKAFEEWKQENPQFVCTEFHKFGWHGVSFIVNEREASAHAN